MKKHVVVAGKGSQPYQIEEMTAKAFEMAGTDASISMDPEIVLSCDLIVLPGGVNDVNPALYGENNTGSCEIIREIDAGQLAMIQTAVNAGKPILGICRGSQLLNVFFGGTLIQNMVSSNIHSVHVKPGTPVIKLKNHEAWNLPGSRARSFYGEHCIINSGHHQAICRLAEDFVVEQLWFSDTVSDFDRKRIMERMSEKKWPEELAQEKCVVEMYRHCRLPIIGVQWHPEVLTVYPDEKAVNGLEFIQHILKWTDEIK